MSSNPHPGTKIGLVQMCSTPNFEENFRKVEGFVKDAKAQGCAFVALPENFAFLGRGPEDKDTAVFRKHREDLFHRYCAIAKDHQIYISYGGFQTKVSEDHEEYKIKNSHFIVNSEGTVVAQYDKIHLFDVDTPDGVFKESSFVNAGNELVMVRDTPAGALGLTICYDLRFPALYTALRLAGAHAILVPSAFMCSTGKAHWEILLRSRAIETQCYILAAAQVGANHEKRSSYGHTMVVDPWGTVVAELDGQKEGLIITQMDDMLLKQVREKMPVCKHHRSDLFPSPPIHVV